MTADYGFRSGSGRLYQAGYGTIPASGWELGVQNFKKELRALRRAVRYGEPDGGTRLPSSGGPLTQVCASMWVWGRPASWWNRLNGQTYVAEGETV